jgi:S1-C subfamily serine protease
VKKIPVLFFWTDYHPDYHKPSDDWDKVATDGLDRVISLVEETVVALAGMEKRPTFVEVPVPVSTTAESGGERAYLGTIPAFGEEVDGVLLSGVSPASPAESSGIRGGDVIVRIGELAIHNLQDMQTALETHRPGDRVKITVQRATNTITFPVTLGRRKQ